MYFLREYIGFVLILLVPITALLTACTGGYLLVMAAKKLTRTVVALTLRKQERIAGPTSPNRSPIQPRATGATGIAA